MKIRIDYLNKDKEVRHTFYNASDSIDTWLEFEIVTILKQWATDIRIYNLTNEKWTT
jgi:hypothetical protein